MIFRNYAYHLRVLVFVLVLILLCGSVYFYVAPFKGYKEVLISTDGNFLFYNNPVGVKYKDGYLISYLKRNGEVVLEYRVGSEIKSSVLVHDHSDFISHANGFADDHAAPAINLNGNGAVLLATAYHGSPMYVYSIRVEVGKMELISTWYGEYTYPRFVINKDDVYLLARNQRKYQEGDFVYRKLSEEFIFEYTIKSSGPNAVVYAGTPDVVDNDLHFTYSLHDYKEQRLVGLYYAIYSLSSNKIYLECDFSNYLQPDYFSTRPTGLKVVGGKVTFAASFFLKPITYKEAEEKNYSVFGGVKIFKGPSDSCGAIEVAKSFEDIAIPYYGVDVAFDDDGAFIFFNRNEVVSNKNIKECFGKDRMMYPNFVSDVGYFYAVMNEEYSIRNFNNSIYGCIKQ